MSTENINVEKSQGSKGKPGNKGSRKEEKMVKVKVNGNDVKFLNAERFIEVVVDKDGIPVLKDGKQQYKSVTPNPSLMADKRSISLEDLGNIQTGEYRKRGGGSERRLVDVTNLSGMLKFSKNTVSMLLIGDELFYIGEIKNVGQILAKAIDVPVQFINASIIVSSGDTRSEITSSSIDRLRVGGTLEEYESMMKKKPNWIGVDGEKYSDVTNKSFSLQIIVPEDNLSEESLEKMSKYVLAPLRYLRDKALVTFDSLLAAKDALLYKKYKRTTMAVCNKDVIKGNIALEASQLSFSQKGIEAIIGQALPKVMKELGAEPMSSMQITFQFSRTRAMQVSSTSADNADQLITYSNVEDSKFYYEHMERWSLKVPTTPEVLLRMKDELVEAKKCITSTFIDVFNSCFGIEWESSEAKIASFLAKTTLGNIQLREYHDFVDNEIPKACKNVLNSVRKDLIVVGLNSPQEIEDHFVTGYASLLRNKVVDDYTKENQIVEVEFD
jgi:hypothetical protein